MQYFAKNFAECDRYFGQDNYEMRITNDASVLCDTKYSKVLPLEEAEVRVPDQICTNYTILFIVVEYSIVCIYIYIV